MVFEYGHSVYRQRTAPSPFSFLSSTIMSFIYMGLQKLEHILINDQATLDTFRLA